MFVKDFYEILKKSLVSYRTALTNGGSPDLSGQIDFAKPDDILERRTAAHIIHYILLNILKETDEQDITMAFELKDIYECKVCLQHIAQVYLKGIMPADGNTFGVRNLVNEVEAKEIACRIFDKASRIRPEVDMPKGSVSVLTEEGLKKLIKECNPLILDIDKISTAEESAALLNNINILEKDFLLWKKDKVIKKCPKCKIFTEKNEGCNHMTCTSCKYQWCWLCEGEYQYGHYTSGRCNGQQFTKADYIEEIEKKKNNLYTSKNYNNNRINNNYSMNYNNVNNKIKKSKKKKKVYFSTDEEDQDCCCSLSSIFICCLHKVNYIKIDYDGYERLNAIFIWFLGYFLFVAYQVYNTSRDDPIKFCSSITRKTYIFFGMLIAFFSFICYEILFTALITPFILLSFIYPFFIYKIKMFFTIGNAHYFDNFNSNNNNLNKFDNLIV